MSLAGASLRIRFSVSNQLGVVSNDIQRDAIVSAPVLADFASEVSALFGGEMLNLSTVRFALTEAEKTANLVHCPIRYSKRGCSGVYYKNAAPETQVGFYLAGLGPWVSAADVQAFIIAHAKMADGTAPDAVFVGAFKLLE